MVTRVHGGIITDQMLTGSIRYFEFGKTGIGADAIGDGNAQAVSAGVAAGGSGYAVNDVLTATPGTGTDPTFTVRTVDGSGAVTSVALTTGGSTAQPLPANPQATTVSPVNGTGATLNVVYKSLIQVPNSDGFFVGVNEPVPGSAAEQVLEVIARRGNIVQIALMDDNTFQVAVENTTWSWVTIDGSGPSGDTDLLDAINALGTVTVPDTTATGTTIDLSTGVTITEKFFSAGIT